MQARIFRLGSFGDDVLAVRRAFAADHCIGWPKVPWKAWQKTYGPLMVRACKKFQKKHQLGVDGKCGPDTFHALQNFVDPYGRMLLKRYWYKHNPPSIASDGADLVTIDGKQVAAGVGAEVLRIRQAGRWKGKVISGFRDPAYSEQLCLHMCGHTSCPGTCAGRDSNHGRKGGRNGAVDVDDFDTFKAECARLGSFLKNDLPSDHVHFSESGH
jgi:Putative peptidoglycan binding domain